LTRALTRETLLNFNVPSAVAVLERTPATLRAMLSGLPGEWTAASDGDATWSPYDVIGHLIHGERTDWIPRAKMILESGEGRTFDPFDRTAQFRESRGRSLDHLLATFEELRRENLATLASWSLTEADLEKTGTHPEFGRVTLAQLLATWVAHDLDHLVQIARTMARQYRGAAGPWTAYLSVMGPR
jgi:hypothetical protein